LAARVSSAAGQSVSGGQAQGARHRVARLALRLIRAPLSVFKVRSWMRANNRDLEEAL